MPDAGCREKHQPYALLPRAKPRAAQQVSTIFNSAARIPRLVHPKLRTTPRAGAAPRGPERPWPRAKNETSTSQEHLTGDARPLRPFPVVAPLPWLADQRPKEWSYLLGGRHGFRAQEGGRAHCGRVEAVPANPGCRKVEGHQRVTAAASAPASVSAAAPVAVAPAAASTNTTKES
jgi:hypothetical protein